MRAGAATGAICAVAVLITTGPPDRTSPAFWGLGVVSD